MNVATTLVMMNGSTDGDIVSEHHNPLSKFFKVFTKAGEFTGWWMGPSDFSGKKKNPMVCSLDPDYEIKKDETILIRPDHRGEQIAATSYYKAVNDGDEKLLDRLSIFGLTPNLDI